MAEQFAKHFPEFCWDLTVDDIRSRCDRLINHTKNLYNGIVSTPSHQANFDTIVKPIVYEDVKYMRERTMLDFYQSVSSDKGLRDASCEADKRFSEFETELSMRKDVYDIFALVRTKETHLKYESDRLLDKLLLYRKRNGLHLSEEVRNEIEALNKRMSLLSIDFNKNLGEENTLLTFTITELDGLPKDFLEGLEKNEAGHFQLTLKYPHVFPVLKMAKVPATRQKVEYSFNSRCVNENVPILEELIELRHKRAQLLGYRTHADYVIEILTAKSSKTVVDFQDALTVKLLQPGKKQLQRLLELKREDCVTLGIPFDGVIHPYDVLYCQRMVEERDFSVDQNIVKEYFPQDKITELLLSMYQSLLRLRFVHVPNAKTWHPEVQLYAVYDEAECAGALMGYFYLDLFPREGKYSHAACFGLQGSCKIDDSNYQLSLAAMVANFSKPLPDKPSLLTHQEVETYFHEFGHVMHQICSRAQYSLFSGTGVETDFVEAPSQMLENWVWEKEYLHKFTYHYKTHETMSDQLISQLAKSRKANAALTYLRQMVLGKFDLAIHTSPKADTFSVIKETQEHLMGISPTPGTNISASFGHMCGGYDSRYYGYLWSEVFACDMFLSRFHKEGIFNPVTGLNYRRTILEPGGTKDGMVLLKDFLGRDPIQEPFLELTGIKDLA